MASRRLALVAMWCASACVAVFSPQTAHAEWVREAGSIAWRVGAATIWRFSFDPKYGKPFFDPVSVGGGPSLTDFKPKDHPWHYGLWFSWKYINQVNYWEEDRVSGKAEGATRWRTPVIDVRRDGSATIRMSLSYVRPTGTVDLTESRTLEISAPRPDGSYTIDWTMRFVAGKNGATLDRTPMPLEPKGAFNGGYAGLSVRLASFPLMVSVVTSEGAVTTYAQDRARPSASALAANVTDARGNAVGGIAILSAEKNIASNAPWYIVNAPHDFRFICAAVLAPAVRSLTRGSQWRLRYRVAVQRNAWSQNALRDAMEKWRTAPIGGE